MKNLTLILLIVVVIAVAVLFFGIRSKPQGGIAINATASDPTKEPLFFGFRNRPVVGASTDYNQGVVQRFGAISTGVATLFNSIQNVFRTSPRGGTISATNSVSGGNLPTRQIGTPSEVAGVLNRGRAPEAVPQQNQPSPDIVDQYLPYETTPQEEQTNVPFDFDQTSAESYF